MMVTYFRTDSPFVRKVVANLWSESECCVVIICVTPETNFTTYVNCALAATVIISATNVR